MRSDINPESVSSIGCLINYIVGVRHSTADENLRNDVGYFFLGSMVDYSNLANGEPGHIFRLVDPRKNCVRPLRREIYIWTHS